MKLEYRNKLRQRLASAAIGPSTIRRMAPAGTIGPARVFLENIDLKQFSKCNEVTFATLLDKITTQYETDVPQLPWGAARKCLNIFLRDCLYNRWVCEDYNLTAIERFLEVPLDGDVVEELKCRESSKLLPRWNGVSKLIDKDSKIFQRHAQVVASTTEVLRVDLDIEYWRGEQAQARKTNVNTKRATKKIT